MLDIDRLDKLKVHESLSDIPKLDKLQRAALKLSIRQHGIVDPIVIWKDSDGDDWLIGGRARKEIYDELQQEGVKLTAMGKKPLRLPRKWFEGSELEVHHFITCMDLRRRSLTPAQAAAVEVLSYEHEEGGTGNVGKMLAERSGCNYFYVVRCREILRKAPDLFSKILNGEISPNDAKKALADRERQASHMR